MKVSENFGIPYFGVLITRILPFRVLYQGHLVLETPVSHFSGLRLGDTLTERLVS